MIVTRTILSKTEGGGMSGRSAAATAGGEAMPMARWKMGACARERLAGAAEERASLKIDRDNIASGAAGGSRYVIL